MKPIITNATVPVSRVSFKVGREYAIFYVMLGSADCGHVICNGHPTGNPRAEYWNGKTWQTHVRDLSGFPVLPTMEAATAYIKAHLHSWGYHENAS